jgi:hypothetical protein
VTRGEACHAEGRGFESHHPLLGDFAANSANRSYLERLPTRPARVVSQHLVSVGAEAVAPSAWRFLPDAGADTPEAGIALAHAKARG